MSWVRDTSPLRWSRWLCLGAMLLCGCDAFPSICRRPESDEPLAYRGGEVQDGIYMSAPWDGELLHYPGGAFYDVYHQLGEEPVWWDIYLSFERYGDIEGNGLAVAPGNHGEVREVTDERLRIVNTTCAEFFVLVVAGAHDR